MINIRNSLEGLHEGIHFVGAHKRLTERRKGCMDPIRACENEGATDEPGGRARHSVRAANCVFKTVFMTPQGLRAPPKVYGHKAR